MNMKARHILAVVSLTILYFIHASIWPFDSIRNAQVIPATSRKSTTKILFLNQHEGVDSEISGLFQELQTFYWPHVDFRITHERGIFGSIGYNVTKEDALAWYRQRSHHYNGAEYDIIVIGDPVSLARPYLEGNCQVTMFVYLSNRFDFGLRNDTEYHQLFAAASTRDNVHIVQNNRFESVYASQFRGVTIHVDATISPRGYPREHIVSYSSDLPPQDYRSLYIVQREWSENVWIPLDMQGAPFNLLPKYYGGPSALADRLIVHVPYQINTMSMYENLHAGAIYLLPSLKLYRTWHAQNKSSLDVIRYQDISDEEIAHIVDWYRPEFAEIIHYFDDVNDLVPRSEFMRTLEIHGPNISSHIRSTMELHAKVVIESWKDLLVSIGVIPSP